MLFFAAAALLPQLAASAPPGAVNLPAPGVEYRTNIASATRKPWVTANGWQMDRGAGKTFFYDAPGHAAAIAAAEAFAHGCRCFIHSDQAGAVPFQAMLSFLKALPPAPVQPLGDFGVTGDSSPASGELLNRLALANFLFRPADSKSAHIIDLSNTDLEKVREAIPDKRRLLRLFGSDVVLGHLTGDGTAVRVHLINYSGRPVRALRVRVLGTYGQQFASVKLEDLDATPEATEFTVVEMADYAVIDLSR